MHNHQPRRRDRAFRGAFALFPTVVRAARVVGLASAVLHHGSGGGALIRPSSPRFSCRGGPAAGLHTPSPCSLQSSCALVVREAAHISRGSSIVTGEGFLQPKWGILVNTPASSGSIGRPLQGAKYSGSATGTSLPASRESLHSMRLSMLGSGASRRARITVRRARERDYQGVADIRGVIIPVGMSGATGFLGEKVVIDDPVEARKRLLMSKVADLVTGEAVALIALEGKRIVGTVDCILQPVAAPGTSGQAQPQAFNNGRGGKQRPRGAAARTKHVTQVFLKNLFVLPEERRKGVARELVKGAEAFAREEKSGTICLDVARNNVAARELYCSCGFEEAERPGPVEGGMAGALLKSLGMGKRYMVKSV